MYGEKIHKNTHTQTRADTVQTNSLCVEIVLCTFILCLWASLSLSLFVGIGTVTFPGDIDFDSCSKALCVLATVNAAVIRMNLYI